MLFSRFRRLQRPILLVCLRILIFVLSMPRGSPSCLRISNLPGEFVEKGPKG